MPTGEYRLNTKFISQMKIRNNLLGGKYIFFASSNIINVFENINVNHLNIKCKEEFAKETPFKFTRMRN